MRGQGTPVSAFGELGRWAVGRSAHTLPAIGLALVESLPKLMPAQAARALELGHELERRIAAVLGAGDDAAVMLYPSYPTTAPRHGDALLPPIHWGYTAILNVLELPATQVPLGLGRGGLPLGVQVASARGGDHRCVAVALALEEAFGGWVPPLQGRAETVGLAAS